MCKQKAGVLRCNEQRLQEVTEASQKCVKQRAPARTMGKGEACA